MDVRVLIPRTRRAIDGPAATGSGAASATLSDDEIKSLVADAIAEVIFYTNGRWGYTLLPSGEDDYGAPDEYDVDPDLTLPEQTVVIAQAALNYFFFEFINTKTHEIITNEAKTWEWERSANLLVEQFKMLRQMRDDALAQVLVEHPALDQWYDFIEYRDRLTAAYTEADQRSIGGQILSIDWRF